MASYLMLCWETIVTVAMISIVATIVINEMIATAATAAPVAIIATIQTASPVAPIATIQTSCLLLPTAFLLPPAFAFRRPYALLMFSSTSACNSARAGVRGTISKAQSKSWSALAL